MRILLQIVVILDANTNFVDNIDLCQGLMV